MEPTGNNDIHHVNFQSQQRSQLQWEEAFQRGRLEREHDTDPSILGQIAFLSERLKQPLYFESSISTGDYCVTQLHICEVSSITQHDQILLVHISPFITVN